MSKKDLPFVDLNMIRFVIKNSIIIKTYLLIVNKAIDPFYNLQKNGSLVTEEEKMCKKTSHLRDCTTTLAF